MVAEFGWLIPAWILGAPLVGAGIMLATGGPLSQRRPLDSR